MKLFLGILLLLNLTGCTSLSGDRKQVVARINGETITVQDLKGRFESRHSGHLALLESEVDRLRFLNAEIDKVLIVQEGYRIGLNKDPGIIRETDQYRTGRIIDRLYNDEVNKKVTVSDSEIEEIYSRFYGRAVKVSLILLKTGKGAEEVSEELKKGGNFSELAREKSIDPSASKGGMLGLIRWGTLDPEIEKVVFSLSPGAVSGPVKVRSGYYCVLRVDEEENFEKKDFSKVKNDIKRILKLRKANQRYKEFIDELKKKYVISADKDPLIPHHSSDIVLARKLLKLEALKRGYDKLPDIIASVRRFKREAVYEKLYKEIVEGVHLTKNETEAYYESHKDEFREPDRVKIRHILVSTKKEAENILEELKKGEDFKVLAREKSIDFSASKGGDLGYIVRGTVIPEFEKAAFSLKPGEISGPVKTRFGWHILKAEDFKKGKVQPFKEVYEKVRKQLLKIKRKAEVKRWIKILKKGSRIKIYKDVLSAGLYTDRKIIK